MSKNKMANRALISVVTPVFNEEDGIRPFYDELSCVIDQLTETDWEIIFVDDGSNDRTMSQVLALCETDPRVKTVQLSRNFGSHAALTAGLSYASGDAAIVISVDLQDPPELIKEFLARWQEGYHVAWGVREARDDPWSKTLFANAFYRLCRRLALPNFPEGGMDCGLFDRRVIDAFLAINERNGYVFANILWSGFRQVQIPYARRARLVGESKWSLGKRVKAALDIIISFSYVPIRLISYLGITASMLSLIYALFLVARRLVWGLGGSGWSSIMVVVLFLGGVQLIMLGILGEYIWRASDQVRGRPLYIVMDQIGFGERQKRGAVSETRTPGYIAYPDDKMDHLM